MILQTLSNIAGLISLGIVLLGAFYVVKMNVGKASSDAQSNAIVALQAEVVSLRNKVGDVEKENTRHKMIIETMISALNTRGLVITVQGEMINISDNNNNNTITRIPHN